MAKALKVLAVDAVEGGAMLRFERLGDRFDAFVETIGLGAFMTLLLRILRAEDAAWRVSVTGLRFESTPTRPGQPPALAVETPDGVIALNLSWESVAGLSQLAEAMLQHQPPPAKPN